MFGQKCSNHSTANAHINNELLLLQDVHYFYVHQHNTTIPVVVYPITILTDRLERFTLNSTLHYTVNSTRRLLYSLLTNTQTILPCNLCFKVFMDHKNLVYESELKTSQRAGYPSNVT